MVTPLQVEIVQVICLKLYQGLSTSWTGEFNLSAFEQIRMETNAPRRVQVTPWVM